MNIAVVTGVSSGIGKSITELLLNNGWKVYGLSRSKPNIVNNLLVWLECDLAKPSSIANTLKAVTEPTIDLLVSNAGVIFEELPSAVTQETYEKMFTVNVLGPMLIVHALKERFAQATIVSISSVSDRLIEKDYALYCSSKAANTRYFEALAEELKQAKVFCLLPHYVDTPMLRKLEGGTDFDWKGTIKAEDIAKFTLELARGRIGLESGSNIIIVTNSLKKGLESREKLYGFNTDTKELSKL